MSKTLATILTLYLYFYSGVKMWRLFVLVSSVCLCAIPALPLETEETEDVQDPGQYLNSFLVQVEKREIAEQVAAQHGFAILNEVIPFII